MKKYLSAFAAAVLIMLYMNVSAATSVAYRPKLAKAATHAENVFCVDGSIREFIMLDSGENGVFVLAKEFYGYHIFDPDESGKFDPLDQNNVAYWLNNDFFQNGNSGKKIPDEMKEYIPSVGWLTEGGYKSTSFSADYTALCRISLLSQTEWSKYVGKFGYADSNEYTQNLSYYLRSTDSSKAVTSKANVIIARASKNGGTTETASSTKNYLIRPCFYLSYDFFKNVRIDIETAGDNVRKFMAENFERSDLESIYSSSELDVIYGGEYAPQITFLTVEGLPVPGYKLSCPESCYEYYSPAGEAEGVHSYRWIRSDGETEETVSEASEYTLTPEDGGHYITLELSPHSVSGRVGKPCRYSVYVQNAVKPSASNLRISGEPVCGEVLYINYNYYDENDDYEADTRFRWQRSRNGIDFEDIAGAESSEYVVSDSDSGFFIRASVTPVSYGALCEGDTVFSSAVGKIKYYPKAAGVSVSGIGGVYTGSYEKISAESYEADDEVYWEVSNSGDYGFIRIDGADGNVFAPSAVYNGKYIRYTVVPAGINGASNRTYSSQAVLVSGIEELLPLRHSENAYVKGEKSFKLFSVRETESYAVSFVIKSDSDAEFEINGYGYEVFSEQTPSGLFCILTKAGKRSAATNNLPLAEIRAVSPGGANISIENAVSGRLTAGNSDLEDTELTMLAVENCDYEWHFYNASGGEISKADTETVKSCGLDARVNVISRNAEISKAVPLAAFYGSDGTLLETFAGGAVSFEGGAGDIKTVKINVSEKDIPQDASKLKLFVFGASALQPVRDAAEFN